MVPCETSIIAKQDAVILITSYRGNQKSSQNILYFGFSCSYLKNYLSDPIFLLHKSD